MLGTIVNSFAIIIGGLLGIVFKKGIKDDFKEIIIQGLGLCIIVLGLDGALETNNIFIVIISLVIGSIIGQWIDIEKKLDKLGNKLQNTIGKGDSDFSKGFVTASLIYCVGAMAIIGSLESGLNANHETLYVKAILDGVSSIIFTSTFGVGVIFSSISVFIYQGIITLSASLLKDLLSNQLLITEMSAVGGVLILGIGINLLGIKKINVANMLPSIFIPLLYYGFLMII